MRILGKRKIKTNRLSIGPVLIFIFVLLLAGCNSGQKENAGQDGESGSANEAEKMKDVTVVLDWFPNTNHTGLYVAKDQGYFAENGLNVEIIQPGKGNTADQLVASGKVEFGVSYQESITQARVQGIPLVSLAAVIQHNTSGFASLKEANITSVKDFEGKRYGSWGSAIEQAVLKAVMEKAGADYSKVENVTLGVTSFFKSIGRDADFEWIYYAWDGVEAKLRGTDLNIIMVKDLHPVLDYYTPVIATSEEMIQNHPEVVREFMAATSKGYEFAIDHPESAADIMIGSVPEINADLVKASQKWLSDKYQADASQWGMQKEEIWENFAKWMYDRELIPKMIDPKKAFTNEFLPKK